MPTTAEKPETIDAKRKARKSRIKQLADAIHRTKPTFDTDKGGGQYAGGVAPSFESLRGTIAFDVAKVAELVGVSEIDGSELESAVESVCESKADSELSISQVDECEVTGPDYEFVDGVAFLVFKFCASGESAA